MVGTDDMQGESQRLLKPRHGEQGGSCDATHQKTAGEQKGLTRTTYFTFVLTFLIEMCNVMLAVPLLALLEQAVCQDHYADLTPTLVHSGGDPCKAPPIQGELALLRGWQGFLNGLSALMLALPVGYFAEHHSHRATMAYVLVGILAAAVWSIIVGSVAVIPNRLLWLTSVFLLCGGGNPVAEMLLAVVIVNSTSEADRTRALYYMYSAFIATELIGPQLSKWCLNHSIWLAFAIGLASLVSCVPVLAMMPESKTPHEEPEAQPAETQVTWKDAWREVYKRVSSVRLLTESRNIRFAIPLFLVGTFRNVSLNALLQYVSARFEWALSDTNWLITQVAIVNLALFFVILPTVLYAVNRWLQPGHQVLNLRIAQLSFFILATGSACISFSRTSGQIIASLAFYSLGFGARATLLSLATFWFDKQVRARLYSAILLLELLGRLSGEAILQSILSASFSLSRPWMGIPFLFCTGCYSVAVLSSFGIQLKAVADENEDEERLEPSQ
ncbi:hypothetical protein K4F52_003000 [Lecanicillium sp. MT-2017a]|nr:hypothetical protein K4F52_003000 [Lecanicillium sp. MT-2017a]